MQDPKEIDASYVNPDPWGYQSNPDDKFRKNMIIAACKMHAPQGGFSAAFDIGCGEGWITRDLPADKIYGYEISKNAKTRFPKNVIEEDVPQGLYDLMVATGVMYSHYDYKLFLHFFKQYASEIIVTCNIKAWEVDEMKSATYWAETLGVEQIHTEEFPYREFIQKLRVFRKL